MSVRNFLHPTITDEIDRKYLLRPDLKDVFYWLWESSKGKWENFECRKVARYVAFYRAFNKGRRTIIAYVDAQVNSVKVGFKKEAIATYDLTGCTTEPNKQWNLGRQNLGQDLVWIVLESKSDFVLELIDASYAYL